VYLKALKSAEEKRKQGEFIKDVMGDPQLRSLGKIAGRLCSQGYSTSKPDAG